MTILLCCRQAALLNQGPTGVGHQELRRLPRHQAGRRERLQLEPTAGQQQERRGLLQTGARHLTRLHGCTGAGRFRRHERCRGALRRRSAQDQPQLPCWSSHRPLGASRLFPKVRHILVLRFVDGVLPWLGETRRAFFGFATRRPLDVTGRNWHPIMSSTKGTAPAENARLPPTSCGNDLEDTASFFSDPAIHRLPVFRRLEAGPPSTTSRSRQQSGRPPSRAPGSLIFTRGAPSVFRRPRAPVTSADRLCGGRCDGVTCMISTASVADAPCLKVDGGDDGGDDYGGEKDVGGPSPPDLSGLPVLDRLCPFHHVTPLWLVPRPFIVCRTCAVSSVSWTNWSLSPLSFSSSINLTHASVFS